MSENDDFSYADILDRVYDEIKEPVTAPSGTWELEITGARMKARAENAKPTTPVAKANYICRLVKACDDVNDAELMDFGDEGIADARVFFAIPIFNRSDEWGVKRFHKNVLGFEPVGGGTLADVVPDTKGYRFYGFLKHRRNPDDPDHPYVDVQSPTPINA